MKFLVSLILVFALGFAADFSFAVSDIERVQLEQQLVEIEKQMNVYENTIDDYRKQGKNLQNEIKKVDAETAKLNLQIKAITLSLAQLKEESEKNKGKIETNEEKLRFNKNALGNYLQAIYDQESLSLAEILLANPTISVFFDSLNNLIDVQDNLRQSLEDISNIQVQLLDEKEQLALRKSDAISLKSYQDLQKKDLLGKKKAKDEILKTTRGQEARYQELLKETKKTATQIRSRIFEFLGGGELTFEQAYKLAKTAGDLVDVKPSLILAVLDKESALGQNVGRCGYQKAMHPTRDMGIFLALVAELALNPDSLLVSCPNRDGAFGGAMGPAQFIPSTWNLYRRQIEELTGNKPPSPWRNLDAFVGVALYLKDAGGAGSNVTLDQARRAAARYYAGKRWQRYLWTYGERVVSRMRQFDEDISSLDNI